jgi:hypothetical protein
VKFYRNQTNVGEISASDWVEDGISEEDVIYIAMLLKKLVLI